MQVRVGTVGGRMVVAAALAAVLGGCAGSADSDGKKSASASASAEGSAAGGAGAKGGAAPAGARIGGAGSACELPVSFNVAKRWKAKSIDAEKELAKASKSEDGDLSGALAEAFLRQGPVTAACEIDAKPAGNIGFLRVWTGKPGEPGTASADSVLRAFVAAEDNVSKEKYRPVKTGGGLDAVEVEYLYTSKLLEETKKERAFAVSTPQGSVVLHLGGMDTQEHEEMLPAYELAKQTLMLS
ncbi:lipoprotein [Streptomyces sp. PBH53]|uniref:lipoprotein n=1 Tax=Streptomyces TaxID=1883 RepID=UPI00065554B6|nr:lipoprotein [Streptomyces sp. PBH53]AKN74025.1 lipoprotein [Streptomyces sp. PBH53]